ncbi:N-acetylmuramoyl-L-alanine amidase [Hydrogenimonas sp.]|nr:N-acetylmuramoyl-L-alanine amidase [Hydrogenimonas sp.]
MKALLDQNRTLQIKALQGLIKASKILGLDPTRYKNALRAVAPELVAKNGTKKSLKSTQKPAASVQKYSTGKTGSKRPRLMKSKVINGRFEMEFDRKVARKSIKHFILERKGRVLYVFDLKNLKVPFSIKRFRGRGFKEIRVARFDPKTVRVVIETRAPYKPKLSADGRRVTITLPPSAKNEKSRSKESPAANLSSKSFSKAAGAAYGKKSYTVVIDPGHGGKDAGAVGYKRKREKDAVLAVAKRLKKVLEGRGFRVYLTRDRDIFIPLKNRTRFANRKKADFFISIHANAAPKRSSRFKSKGIETYFLSPARSERAKRVAAIENRADVNDLDRYTKNTYLSLLNNKKMVESNKLAIDLQKQILSSLRKKYRGVVDNGVREGPFWVLVGAQMPAVLIEIGYITHPTEAKRLFNPNYQKLLAEGIANGIESYIYHNGI